MWRPTFDTACPSTMATHTVVGCTSQTGVTPRSIIGASSASA
jgi:hypothetical protein